MAAFINDRVFDNGLTVLDTEATGIYLCSQQPTTYTEAVTTYALAAKSRATHQAHQPMERQTGGE